jgi:hypothetical protein
MPETTRVEVLTIASNEISLEVNAVKSKQLYIDV